MTDLRIDWISVKTIKGRLQVGRQACQGQDHGQDKEQHKKALRIRWEYARLF